MHCHFCVKSRLKITEKIAKLEEISAAAADVVGATRMDRPDSGAVFRHPRPATVVITCEDGSVVGL
ncbi:hypothetical protein FBQ90_01380 [Betaproteobacteria bacterium PRO5]|nr:hypothetical protein [Betaproteobacteria bacterium PRO5]